MAKTIRGDRLHIGFFGKRNSGKSSLINAITKQHVAIVSEVPGTTTDPVFKSMELAPVGPVVLIDTAGIDDTDGKLGELRKERAHKIIKKTDLALIIIDASTDILSFEDELIELFESSETRYIIVLNKIDLPMSKEVKSWLENRAFVRVSALHSEGIELLKSRIIEIAPASWEPPFVGDLIHPEDIVLLVTPIDLGAPKGRLIMPQVKALRDILDQDAIPMMCKERELISTLSKLSEKPSLVITDSQVFPQVAADVPEDILITSFSILSIRQKGDLRQMVDGILSIKSLRPNDKVLISEACTHHPLEDDIGRVKIPRWLNHYVGGKLDIDTVPGFKYPERLEEYKLIIHCGGCTLNRKEMMHRQELARKAGIPITNYGVLISFLKSVFPRALKPFPEIYRLFEKEKKPLNKETRLTMAKLIDV